MSSVVFYSIICYFLIVKDLCLIMAHIEEFSIPSKDDQEFLHKVQLITQHSKTRDDKMAIYEQWADCYDQVCISRTTIYTLS